MSKYFFVAPTEFDEKAKVKAWGEGSRAITVAIREHLATLIVFNAKTIEQGFLDVGTKLDLKLGNLVHPIRLAVSGVAGGPGLFELLDLLGQSEVISRLEVAEPLMS
jgi:glutamyl-tRNA synthetase